MEIEIHRVSCRACKKIFHGRTVEEAQEKHRQHIKNCPTIKAFEKVSRFQEKASKILGREVTAKEACILLGIKNG